MQSSPVTEPSRLPALSAARGLVAGCAGLLLAACAPMTPPPGSSEPRSEPAPQPQPAVRSTPLSTPDIQEEALPMDRQEQSSEPATSPAVLALVRQADQRRASGDLAGAQSTLERAVQIEPGNARLWLDLAQLRLAQNQPEQAEQLALRAVEHARDNRTLSAAWQLVAKARRAQGDEAGAREAEERAGSESAGRAEGARAA
ncbi:tetratricopeptide repeat protein [Guyparkeria halophila]|uniref:Tetratricopeptide repeat protein n=1 Tax=Guyparkeria halophila TaxID=47960 RepID=A0ABZ0YUN5_9GAMM|nr:tetratricopeptide repeat protein [Guyparkeria halophila]WQH15883.1 tetratricopeptide repeat protein [Guyparkeria halophila]